MSAVKIFAYQCERCKSIYLDRETAEKCCAPKLSEGYLYELPCKIGDTVYYFDQFENEVYKEKVDRITIYDGYIMVAPLNWSLDDFGKTVFLSKEDAKKALKGRQKKIVDDFLLKIANAPIYKLVDIIFSKKEPFTLDDILLELNSVGVYKDRLAVKRILDKLKDIGTIIEQGNYYNMRN